MTKIKMAAFFNRKLIISASILLRKSCLVTIFSLGFLMEILTFQWRLYVFIGDYGFSSQLWINPEFM